MKKILMIISTSLLFVACGNQNTPTGGNAAGSGGVQDTQAVAQPDSDYNMRDSVPNRMHDTGQANPNRDTSGGSRGQ